MSKNMLSILISGDGDGDQLNRKQILNYLKIRQWKYGKNKATSRATKLVAKKYDVPCFYNESRILQSSIAENMVKSLVKIFALHIKRSTHYYIQKN